MKIYMLRILPPISHYRSYFFESIDALLSACYTLYESIRLDDLDLNENDKLSWKKRKFLCFCESIQIITIESNTREQIQKLFPSSEKLCDEHTIIPIPKLKEDPIEAAIA